MDKAKEGNQIRIAAVVLAVLIALTIAGGGFLMLQSGKTANAQTQEEGTTAELKVIEPGEGETKVVESISVSAKGSSKGEDAKKTDSKDDEEEEGEDAAANKDYILPSSNTKLLTSADISGLSLKELNYAKNEIYARHGRKFDSKELREYFESKSWYEGKYSAADFDNNYSAGMLSDTERKNAEFLKSAEYAMSPSGYQLDQ